MTAIDDILGQVPMDQLAAQLGVDEATADAATRQALPALLGGLQANAADPAGAASLMGALGDHADAPTPDDLGQVDTFEGQKIVGNIFGPHTDQVTQNLGQSFGSTGAAPGGDLMRKLLPILAPIVLRYLASRVGGGQSGGLLGSILGGAAGGGAGGGGGLSDILGQLTGGGATPTSNPGQPTAQPPGSILDMLGGLLGAGRR